MKYLNLLFVIAVAAAIASSALAETPAATPAAAQQAASNKPAEKVAAAATPAGPSIASCFTEVQKGNINGVCIKLFVSKAISMGIISLSFTLKVPQIKNMVAAGSSKGVDMTALYLEILSYILSAGYNVAVGSPLSTYGELLIILVQNFVILVLCWKYLNSSAGAKVSFPSTLLRCFPTHFFSVCAFIGTLPFALTLCPLLSPLFLCHPRKAAGIALCSAAMASFYVIPAAQLPLTMTAAIGASMFSRVKQIIANFTAGSTGVLSIVTVGLQVAGSLARIFTTLQEVNDWAVLSSYLSAFSLNLIVMLQIVYYWKVRSVFSFALSSSRDVPFPSHKGLTSSPIHPPPLGSQSSSVAKRAADGPTEKASSSSAPAAVEGERTPSRKSSQKVRPFPPLIFPPSDPYPLPPRVHAHHQSSLCIVPSRRESSSARPPRRSKIAPSLFDSPFPSSHFIRPTRWCVPLPVFADPATRTHVSSDTSPHPASS